MVVVPGRLDSLQKTLLPCLLHFCVKYNTIRFYLQVSQLQQADAQVRENIGFVLQSAEKLIAGKMNKNQYIDTETTFKAKREELCQKMENILASL